MSADGYRSRHHRFYEKHKERLREKRREYYWANKEKAQAYAKVWGAQNKEKRRVNFRKWKENNPGRPAELFREWADRNRIKYRALKKLRKHHIRRATPSWVDRGALTKIYEGCPRGYHVDHIMPLRGQHSCGLHVPWNLQYLTPAENNQKGNGGCQTWL